MLSKGNQIKLGGQLGDGSLLRYKYPVPTIDPSLTFSIVKIFKYNNYNLVFGHTVPSSPAYYWTSYVLVYDSNYNFIKSVSLPTNNSYNHDVNIDDTHLYYCQGCEDNSTSGYLYRMNLSDIINPTLTTIPSYLIKVFEEGASSASSDTKIVITDTYIAVVGGFYRSKSPVGGGSEVVCAEVITKSTFNYLHQIDIGAYTALDTTSYAVVGDKIYYSYNNKPYELDLSDGSYRYNATGGGNILFRYSNDLGKIIISSGYLMDTDFAFTALDNTMTGDYISLLDGKFAIGNSIYNNDLSAYKRIGNANPISLKEFFVHGGKKFGKFNIGWTSEVTRDNSLTVTVSDFTKTAPASISTSITTGTFTPLSQSVAPTTANINAYTVFSGIYLDYFNI